MLLVAAASATGCAAPKAPPVRVDAPAPQRVRIRLPEVPSSANAVCPITGMPVQRDTPTVAHRGRKVGFCSSDCIHAWLILGDTDRDTLLKMGERNRRRIWRLGSRTR